MKKKTKKKKTPVKKEIKRPAHKKPRAKKHVEAKIPQLPPVPTQLVEAKEAAIEWGAPIEGTTQIEPGIYQVNHSYNPPVDPPKKSGLFAFVRRLLGF